MTKHIHRLWILGMTLFTLPLLASSATVNELTWQEAPLEITDDVSCTFDAVVKFKNQFYAFSGEQLDLNGDGKPFVALTSTDGQHWQAVSEPFGRQGDTAIMSSIVWENKAEKTHLYVAAKNVETGVNVYRTADGLTWERVVANGLNSKNHDSIRTMVNFQGKLYLFTENDIDNGGHDAQIFVSDTGETDDWEVLHLPDSLVAPGFLTAANLVHKKADGSKQHYLYVITGDTTLARTSDGKNWTVLPFNIFKYGYGVKLAQFDGYVYMATYNEFTGRTSLLRSQDPTANTWVTLDLGVDTEELITVLARKKKHAAAKFLYFSTYPSGYMFRIGQDATVVERVSDAHLGFSTGPTFVVNIILNRAHFLVYDNTSEFWQKE